MCLKFLPFLNHVFQGAIFSAFLNHDFFMTEFGKIFKSCFLRRDEGEESCFFYVLHEFTLSAKVMFFLCFGFFSVYDRGRGTAKL